MLQQNLNDFVTNWNRTHPYISFAIVEAPTSNRPVNIEVRFAADRYVKFISEEEYKGLKAKVVVKSKALMFVATDYYLFGRGIIELKVASSSGSYQATAIANTLEWIGGGFFPRIS